MNSGLSKKMSSCLFRAYDPLNWAYPGINSFDWGREVSLVSNYREVRKPWVGLLVFLLHTSTSIKNVRMLDFLCFFFSICIFLFLWQVISTSSGVFPGTGIDLQFVLIFKFQ